MTNGSTRVARKNKMFVDEEQLRRDYTKGELSEMMKEVGVNNLGDLADEINKMLAQNQSNNLDEVF